MIPMKITFVGLPDNAWSSFPAERPFTALVADIEGAARRISKGVNVRHERRKLSQLCQHTESSALELVVMRREGEAKRKRSSLPFLNQFGLAELADTRGAFHASAYVALIDALCSDTTSGALKSRVARNVFSQGESVQQHIGLLRSLQDEPERVTALNLPTLYFPVIANSISRVYDFFAEADSHHRGVIQVISVIPDCA